MVGVRSQCCTDILLIGIGIPPVQCLVYSWQKTVLAKLRPHFPSSPVQKALDLAIGAECPMGKWVSHLEGISDDSTEIELQRIRASVASNTSSCHVMYRLCPQCTLPSMYIPCRHCPWWPNAAAWWHPACVWGHIASKSKPGVGLVYPMKPTSACLVRSKMKSMSSCIAPLPALSGSANLG